MAPSWLRKRKRLLVTVLVALTVVVAGYSAFIWFLVKDAEETVQDPGLDRFIDPPESEAPFIALLVGSDSREGLTEEEQERLGAQDVNPDGTPITGERADTLILVKVDPATEHMTMVQFPRDLYVSFPDGSTGKVNAALDRGRPFLVESIEAITGLDLNRYAQVNIAGFRDIIDAIGGVDVCFPKPIPFDDATGFEITADQVGVVHLDGEQALRFVRTRNVFAEGDFERITNQQKLLAAAISKVATLGTLLRPDRITALFEAVKDSVKTDSYSSLRDLQSLGEAFKVLTEEKLDAYVVPNRGTAINEAGDVVLPAGNKMRLLFSAMASDGPIDAEVVGALEEWEIDVPLQGSSPRVCR